MVVLILPAFLGGRMTNYLLKIDSLFLVSPLLKWGVLGGLRAGVILFYVIFLNKNFTHLSPKNRVIANLWRLPIFSGQLPVASSRSVGDLIHKISDFSWLFYIYFNFYFSIRRFFITLGGMFHKTQFIYRLRNMFIILLLFILFII